MTDRALKLGLLIPLVGVLVLIAKAELATRAGPTWRIAIEGHQPRDLLHGRHLRFDYRFRWVEASTCGAPSPTEVDPVCCVCLIREQDDGIDPPARQVGCDEVAECDGWLSGQAVSGVQRYFVPEDRASELGEAMLAGTASLEIACGPGGVPAPRELYLRGRPWRQALASD